MKRYTLLGIIFLLVIGLTIGCAPNQRINPNDPAPNQNNQFYNNPNNVDPNNTNPNNLDPTVPGDNITTPDGVEMQPRNNPGTVTPNDNMNNN